KTPPRLPIYYYAPCHLPVRPASFSFAFQKDEYARGAMRTDQGDVAVAGCLRCVEGSEAQGNRGVAPRPDRLAQLPLERSSCRRRKQLEETLAQQALSLAPEHGLCRRVAGDEREVVVQLDEGLADRLHDDAQLVRRPVSPGGHMLELLDVHGRRIPAD